MAKEALEMENLTNYPHGKDVSVHARFASLGTTTVINSISVTTDKVVYVRGINFVDRANLVNGYVELNIDRGTANAQTIGFYMPPGPITKFDEIDCFRPPHKALNSVELLARGSTTITNMVSMISAFEADL